MTIPSPDKPKTQNQARRLGCIAAIVVILISILACISGATTFGIWDGLFPAGEYHLKVRSENGQPIKGAILNVFNSGTSNFSYKYPVDNYISDHDLISNEQGI